MCPQALNFIASGNIQLPVEEISFTFNLCCMDTLRKGSESGERHYRKLWTKTPLPKVNGVKCQLRQFKDKQLHNSRVSTAVM